MQVIALNKRILKLFGMCLSDADATEKERLISKCINWVMLTISICTVAISIEYIYSHFGDTESILFAVMQVVANTASGGGYWTFYRKKYEVSKFIDEIEKVVMTRELKRIFMNNFRLFNFSSFLFAQ